VHQPSKTLVLADLHLGYNRVRQRKGAAVPVRGIGEELRPLSEELSRENGIERLIIAGDLFEDSRCDLPAMIEELRDWLNEVGIELVAVVPGNHDRNLKGCALPIVATGIELGEFLIIHGDGEIPQRAILQGHEHPWFRWRVGVEGPCFLVSSQRVILPAWSRDAAGCNVLRGKDWERFECWVIVGEQVLNFGEVGKLQKQS
jgi:putative SbcD/Mre11-related phosphoesterase